MRPRQQYQDRVNRVLDHIGQNLDGELSLARLSEISGFSPFHFHRIFQGVTGETLNSYVRRARVEWAAQLLRGSPRKRITDVALDVGFAGTAEFSRAFKNHFGRAPSSWDRRSPLENSKIGKAENARPYHTEEDLERWKAGKNARVRVERLGAFRFVYQRIYAPYGNTKLVDSYNELIAWLAARSTDFRDVVFVGMSMDDPFLTPAESCRYDLGVAFPRAADGLLREIVRGRGRKVGAPPPDQTECDVRGLTIREFEPLQVGAVHCEGDIGDVDRAWHYLYRIWLPRGRCDLMDLPAMEVFVKIPEEIGWTMFDVLLCLPVVRL
ncbi:MAG: AraC family transcriptional regulator [Acidobacteria bacterium]|nr:AraC family transcriptional regulator [Acidobacteriota bacterium]